jgi:hypothetical protein
MNRTDTFARANNPTSLGTPSDGGSAWNPLAGTWGIISNAAYNPSAGNPDFAALDSLTTDTTVQATLQTFAAFAGLCLRATDAANQIFLQCTTTASNLYTQVSGGFTLLGTSGTIAASGDVLSLSGAGTAIEAKINGTSIITATTSTNATGTLHGLYAAVSAAEHFTAFSITDAGPPPSPPTKALLPIPLTFCQYTPATMTAMSSLRISIAAAGQPDGTATPYRNIVIKGALADAAWTWILSETPAALQLP